VDQNANPLNFNPDQLLDADRTKMATLIADDLKQIGIKAQVFRSNPFVLDRVTQTKEYDACVLGLAEL